MKRLILFGLLLAISVTPVSADDQYPTANLKGIVRVFMHQPREFSFLVLDDKGIGRLVYYETHYRAVSIEFIFDVPEDKTMWMESDFYASGWLGNKCTWMKIHVHSPEDINGAGWTRRIGKSTVRGTTVVMQ